MPAGAERRCAHASGRRPAAPAFARYLIELLIAARGLRNSWLSMARNSSFLPVRIAQSLDDAVRLIRRCRDLAQCCEQAGVLGVEMALAVMRHSPDRATRAAADQERCDQQLEDRRIHLGQTAEVAVRADEQLHGVASDRDRGGRRFLRRDAPETVAERSGHGVPAESLLAVPDARRCSDRRSLPAEIEGRPPRRAAGGAAMDAPFRRPVAAGRGFRAPDPAPARGAFASSPVAITASSDAFPAPIISCPVSGRRRDDRS